MRRFNYARAGTAGQAVATGQAAGELPGSRVKFLAGGTTLRDLMTLDVERPTHVVDVNSIGELSSIDTSGDELVFGALARMADVAADPVVAGEYPALSEALWKAASAQLRTMASVGGNLLQRTRCAYFRGGETFACNKRTPGSGCSAIGGLDRNHALLGASDACTATYPGDWANALLAFDALIDVTGPAGNRTLVLSELHVPPGDTPEIETTLAPAELVTAIRVPKTPRGRASTYHKIRDRESYAFAIASAAVSLELDGDTVRDARIALGGVASTPWRSAAAEQALIGRTLTPESALAAGEAAMAAAVPLEHNGFKVALTARTVADALMIAKARA